MARFRWILTAFFLLAACLYPVTAGAYVAYSPGYSGSHEAGSYFIAHSQPINYYTGLPSPGRPVPAPTPNPIPPSLPDPEPVPAPTPDPAPNPSPEPSPVEPLSLTQDEQLLLNLVNAERAKNRLPELKVDLRLIRLARLKSQDMLDLGYFAHLSPTYGHSGDMLRSAGIKFYLAAENIGMGRSVTRIFNAFMNSPGHRSKILDSRYTHTGIGIVCRQGQGYRVTQLFLKPR